MAATHHHSCEFCEKLKLSFHASNFQHPPETEYLFDEFTARDTIAAAGHGCSLCSWILYPNSMEWLRNKIPDDYKLYFKYIPATKDRNAEIREFGFRTAVNTAPAMQRRGRFVMYACSSPKSEMSPPKAMPPEESIRRAKTWLKECPEEEKDTKGSPRRLIEIHADGDNLKLKLCSGDEVRKPYRYAALSYSWGGNQSFKTTKTNELERRGGIEFGHLPKTIQDAVKVTSGLGINYLWIDSQCILQDSDDDQRNEFLEQARIYSGAEITIAASKSWNHREGFLDDVVFKLPSKTGGWFLLWKQNPPEEPEPLSTRGWVFQEYMLSRRILFYETYRLRFVSGSFEREMDWYDNIRPPVRQRDYCGQPGDGNRLEQLNNHTHDIIERWYRCVEDFSRRDLTMPVDKIPAMTGLAARYMTALNRLPFASGIWLRTRTTNRPDGEVLPAGLAAGLLWKMKRPGPWKLRRPAWSWASSAGEVDMSSVVEYLDQEPDIEVTDFGEYRSRLRDFRVYREILGRLFARTVGETVKLTGRTHSATLKREDAKSAFNTIEVTMPNGTLADLPVCLDANIGPDLAALNKDPGNPWGPIEAQLLTSDNLVSNLKLPITLLRLYPQPQNTSPKSIIGLLLLGEEKGSYIRLGTFEFSLPNGRKQEQGADWQILNDKFNQSQPVSIKLL